MYSSVLVLSFYSAVVLRTPTQCSCVLSTAKLAGLAEVHLKGRVVGPSPKAPMPRGSKTANWVCGRAM